MEFAVNKDSENLEMANEFMRFLISPEQLDNMSVIKRLVTPTVNLSFDGIFAAFGNCDEAHTAYAQSIGLLDAPLTEARKWNRYIPHCDAEESFFASCNLFHLILSKLSVTDIPLHEVKKFFI